MHILGNEGKIFGDAAFRRMKLGFGLLMTVPGLPMIWMGNEFGMACARTLDPCPLDWSLPDNPTNRDLLEQVKRLSRIRRENAALRGDSFQVVLKEAERSIIAFKRWDGAGNVVVTVAHLKDEPAGEFQIQDAALEDGMWRDAIHGNEIKVEGGVLRDVIDASEVKIYIKQ
jgi:1,4-alpha-glucan branching enzyme